jgi:membrane-associated HD superfamily phosphohydrolase
MLEQLMSLDFVRALSLKTGFLIQTLNSYLEGGNNLKLLSLLLILLAFILFLCLVIIIHIRNIIYFVKSNNVSGQLASGDSVDDDDETDDAANQELERELQKELELAQAEQAANEEAKKQKALEKKSKEEHQAEKQKKAKEKESENKKNKERQSVGSRHKDVQIDLDWQKGRIPPAELAEKPDVTSLSYKQSVKDLNQLIGLLIDMLGRGVDDLKIAQTLNYKNQGMVEENEILKTVDAVKQFINLCVSGKFAKLKQYTSLPHEDEALYHLANGDASLALALMENLMDAYIDKANTAASEDKKQALFTEVSGYACCFGTLAELNDVMLATSAYELAIELLSTNVVAWGRIGDVYHKTNALSKAAWAYQNVLGFADEEVNADQIANANRHLSEQLYADGNSLQAATLYNSAKQYYDSLGISRRLDKQEIEIIQIIEENQTASLPDTIHKLLAREYA